MKVNLTLTNATAPGVSSGGPVGTGSGDYPFYTSIGGYTCAYCGGWVPSGTTHFCSTYPVYPNLYPVYTYPTTVDLQPLIDKLDELMKEIKALKKLAKDK